MLDRFTDNKSVRIYESDVKNNNFSFVNSLLLIMVTLQFYFVLISISLTGAIAGIKPAFKIII